MSLQPFKPPLWWKFFDIGHDRALYLSIDSDILIYNFKFFIYTSRININSKIKAMRCYNSEIEKNHPRSIENIKSFAKYNGSIMGVDYAEPFVLGYLKK